MNFNLLFILFIFFAACGVKGNPKAPGNQSVPSVLENYDDIKTDKPLGDANVRKK